MQVNFDVKDKNLIVRFIGELDHHSAEDIRKSIDEEYRKKMLKNIVLDLKGISFMDSSGIGLIMGRYKNAQGNNGKLALINVNPRMEKILFMSGILKIVKVYQSEVEALSNI